jgi:hypothetical protein
VFVNSSQAEDIYAGADESHSRRAFLRQAISQYLTWWIGVLSMPPSRQTHESLRLKRNKDLSGIETSGYRAWSMRPIHMSPPLIPACLI